MRVVFSVKLFTLLCIQIVFSVSVQIDGVIDLGPNWNYEYKLESVHSVPATPKMKTSERSTSFDKKYIRYKSVYVTDADVENKAPEMHVTQYRDKYTPNKIYENPHIVKEDSKIKDFAYHVYKQSLKVFDEIKKKIDPSLTHRVDMLTRSYDEKFREFLNDTLNQKIKTRLGSQRVILNTIDTSNRLMRRLLNYFIGDLSRDDILRTNEVAVNVFQKEVEMECDLEIMHVCTKFGICRSSKGFTDFLIDFFTIIIKQDDKKIKVALDALTEVSKNTDFSSIMGSKERVKFLNTIDMIEKYDGKEAKAMFWIAKNMLALKNMPLKIMTAGGKQVDKTVALLEVFNELDKTLPANEENRLEWTDMKNSLSDWGRGKRQDILEVMQGLVNHLKKAFDQISPSDARNLNNKLDIVFT